jgi:hypothetical protein
MVMHMPANAAIQVFGLDEFTTITRTRNHLDNDNLAMKGHMARAAKCSSVSEINPEIGELRIWLD